MGGQGSGNRYHTWRNGKKRTVEGCLDIDTNQLMRRGGLKAGVRLSGSWRRAGDGFTVNYEIDTLDLRCPSIRLWHAWPWSSQKQRESADYRARLAATRPRFGGLRWWFVCPLGVGDRPCGRRVGKLYLPPHGRYFGCRHCHGLTYTSCQESRKYDRLHQAIALNMGRDVGSVRRIMNRMRKRR
jgi:hypothetical protein